MNMFILDSEVPIRFGFFFGIFAVMAIWETASPRRGLNVGKIRRWFINLSITFMNPVALRLVFPLPATGVALIASERGWGAMNMLQLDGWTAAVVAVVLLDLAIYLQHLFFHHNNFFWRLHMVHHTDLDLDVTTGARFHPFEIVISMVIKMTVVVIIGAPVWSVFAFEVILNGTSMFNHSNVYIPLGLDGVLRKLIVTPDMHRVHHSVFTHEHNRNFGFNLSVWDRIFGTYQAQPEAGHQGMTIGLTEFREESRLSLPYVLALPIVWRRG